MLDRTPSGATLDATGVNHHALGGAAVDWWTTRSISSGLAANAVSVVIPAYNAERFIAEAIDSVLSQTLAPLEVIVVNDGSTDGTARILRRYDDRVVVLDSAGGSAAAARNAGAAAAAGDWIAFLDADDTWMPMKLELQLATATAEPDVALVYSDRLNIGDRGPLPERQSDIQTMYRGDVFQDLLLVGNRITLSSAIVRTSVFRELGGFSESLRNAEDWDLWIRVAERHRVAVCDEPLVGYRFHDGMKSADPRRMMAAREEIVRRTLGRGRGLALPPHVRRDVLADLAKTNAWDAARRGARSIAFGQYLRAVRLRPWDPAPYADLVRLVLGRHEVTAET